MKTILVTGANGYIGRHVLPFLDDSAFRIIAVDRAASLAVDEVAFVSADIFEPTGILIDKVGCIPDACLHLAWRNGFDHNNLCHISDLSRHFDFLAGLAEAGVKQIAVMGTMHEIGYWEGAVTEDTPCNPKSLYGIAKNTLRQALSLFFQNKENIVFQWIRGFYTYGDDENSQSIFGKIYRAAQRGQRSFPFTTGKNKYDFLPIDTLGAQIAAVAMQTEIDGIINCCSGTPLTLAECVEDYIRKNDFDISLEYGAFPDRPYDSPGLWGDSEKIETILKTKVRH